jgi:hypothetical protein
VITALLTNSIYTLIPKNQYLGFAEQSYNRLLIGVSRILRTSKCKVLANEVSKQLHFSLSDMRN